MNILALDEAVADRAIALRRQRNMGLGDAIIAATALVHGIALVTRNTREFQHVENLQLIDPFTPA
jgi:predicted nucleic acid-binding protein